MTEMKWVRIPDDVSGNSARSQTHYMAVPGGRIYRTIITGVGYNTDHPPVAVHQIFVPD